MTRTILVVEDNALNRRLLASGLCSDYDVVECADGQEAMELIELRFAELSAVLLDLQMPVMDGFEVLRRLRQDARFAQLPVIVVTGSDDEETRLKALRLGANDFVSKPYNPEIIRHCLRNNIELRETASRVNAIQRDRLTGLYNREFFFEKAGELIESHPSGYYVMASLDIDNFKLINDQYGPGEGDRILAFLGEAMRTTFEEVRGICGRISGDNFAALIPNEEEALDFVAYNRVMNFLPPNAAALSFSVGRCVVSDLALPATAHYDRAYIAKRSVKGRYDAHMAYFNESMLAALVLEQQITVEMDRALTNREFEVWYQPQYNHASGALIGAEALVRWRHPKRGLIPPGDFIPVFEKNGFIYELDKYVWEETCRQLRAWLDEGREPLPVSVNISRYDVFRTDIEEVLKGLVEKYRLPASLLRLEITESAFSASSEQLIRVVKSLIGFGYTIEIDDFGCGYSSLNTLKDVPAQILKLDMRFLEANESAQRGGSILESITRMARWIGMAVIAEGVETVEQADFLLSIGCNYIQGFLYGRPMPAADYRRLALDSVVEKKLSSNEKVVHFNIDSFWDPKSMDTIIFNSFVGGACILEVYGEAVELLRVNDSYIRELGITSSPGVPLTTLDPFNYMPPEDKTAVHAAVERAIDTNTEQTCDFSLLRDGVLFTSTQYVSSSFRVIARAGDRYLIYCILTNITAQHEAERKEREAVLSQRAAAQQLRAIMENMDGGVTASINRDGEINYLFANDKYYELIGYSREEYDASFHGALISVHPDDRDRVAALAARASRDRSAYSVEYRVIHKNGAVRWLRSNVSLIELPGIDEPVQLAVVMDVTEQAESSSQLQFLNDMAHKLLAQPDAEESLMAALDRLRDYFGGSRAYIFEFDFEAGLANNTYEVCAPGTQSMMENLHDIKLELMSFWLEAFRQQDFYAISSVEALDESHAGEKELLEAQGVSSLFAVPIYRDGRLIGMMGIDDPGRQSSQMRYMTALGDYIAVMLTRRDLNLRLSFERIEPLAHRSPPGQGLRETVKKTDRLKKLIPPRAFIIVTLIFCAVALGLILFASPISAGGRIDTFREAVVELDEGWTLTDSSGDARELTLPYTFNYSGDGSYTLTGVLPSLDTLINSPVLSFYSNYLDFTAELDGETLISYPSDGDGGATGNTYHYLRLPPDYAGKTLTLRLRCQLGDDISYLLRVPQLGSKATMFIRVVQESLPTMLLAGCMFLLALMLGVLYVSLRKKLDLNGATAFTALFALLFSAYIFCETTFAQNLLPNPYALFSLTLMLLALIPLPLIGVFAEDISEKFRRVPVLMMLACSVNFAVQAALHFSGLVSLRVMIIATHAVIILSIVSMMLCLFFSDRKERPFARKRLLSALPLLAGGVADITLIIIERPSFNNSFWFTLGVTCFIVIQFYTFVRGFFVMYRSSLEAGVLRDLAFRDMLTGLGNRNAYERRLKELSAQRLRESLCCIVIDINDLKQLNDRYGHSVGDAAIVETSRIIKQLTPTRASCFRAGGDEFIIFIEDFDRSRIEALADGIGREALRRGTRCEIPLRLAIGFGSYEREDGNLMDFIRRIDAAMYSKKQAYKQSPDYPFR